MDKKVSVIRAESWERRICDMNRYIAENGVSKAEWCRQNGVKLRQLYYWQRRLREKGFQRMSAQDTALSVPAVPSGEALQTAATFVELPQFSVSSTETVVTATEFTPELMLQTEAGSLYIGRDVSAVTLRTVLMVMHHA